MIRKKRKSLKQWLTNGQPTPPTPGQIVSDKHGNQYRVKSISVNLVYLEDVDNPKGTLVSSIYNIYPVDSNTPIQSLDVLLNKLNTIT